VLPDFPALKAKFNERVIHPRMLAVEVSRMGPFAASPHMIIHEGGSDAINEVVHEDGTVDHSSLAKAEVKVEQDLRELEKATPAALFDKLDKIAGEMGSKMLARNMEKLHSILEAADRGVDMRGKPLTADAVLDVWRGMLISFDDRGEPRMPTVIAHPDTAKRLMELLEKAKNDEGFNRRYLELIEQKRMEWRAREASRILVG